MLGSDWNFRTEGIHANVKGKFVHDWMQTIENVCLIISIKEIKNFVILLKTKFEINY